MYKYYFLISKTIFRSSTLCFCEWQLKSYLAKVASGILCCCHDRGRNRCWDRRYPSTNPFFYELWVVVCMRERETPTSATVPRQPHRGNVVAEVIAWKEARLLASSFRWFGSIFLLFGVCLLLPFWTPFSKFIYFFDFLIFVFCLSFLKFSYFFVIYFLILSRQEEVKGKKLWSKATKKKYWRHKKLPDIFVFLVVILYDFFFNFFSHFYAFLVSLVNANDFRKWRKIK